MKRKRFTVEQIVAVLKQAEAGDPMTELVRRVRISEYTFYRWKRQYVRLEVDQVHHLKQLQEENTRLKQVVADPTLDKAMLQDFHGDAKSRKLTRGLVQKSRSDHEKCASDAPSFASRPDSNGRDRIAVLWRDSVPGEA